MNKKLLLFGAIMMALSATAGITPTESQMWWGYFTDDDASGIDYVYDGLGLSRATTMDACISIPAGDTFVGNRTIKALRFWLSEDVTKVSSDVTVWVSRTQPTDISSCECVQTVANSALIKGLNEVMLNTPFSTGNSDVYVGFTLTTNQKAYPLICRGTDVPNSLYLRTGGEWDDLYDYGYGKLALQILLDGGNFPTNCATVSDFGQETMVAGESFAIPVKITNGGKNAIENFTYTITTDKTNVSAPQTVTLSTPLSFGGSYTLNIPMSDGTENKKYEKVVTVTNVNGQPNTAADNTGTGYVIWLNSKVPVTPVVEEFTGTWCGYCPYGTVGMSKAHDKYGDQVVLIAVHSGDVMDIGDYDPVIDAYVDGYPSSYIDRITEVYPYYLVSYLDNSLKRTAQGTIALKAMWASSEKNAVVFDTKTTFEYDDENGNYAIAYVLVEDGLKGTTSQWNQSNYLSGESGLSSDMAFWGSAPSSVSGLEYNHVAVAAWDVKDGVDGSVNARFSQGQILSNRFTGDITTKKLIQDKTKLSAAVLLIDRLSNTVVNAAQATISGAIVTGDVNGDTAIDVADIGSVIDVMAGSTEYSKAAADVNGDGIVDVADIAKLISLMAGGAEE